MLACRQSPGWMQRETRVATSGSSRAEDCCVPQARREVGLWEFCQASVSDFLLSDLSMWEQRTQLCMDICPIPMTWTSKASPSLPGRDQRPHSPGRKPGALAVAEPQAGRWEKRFSRWRSTDVQSEGLKELSVRQVRLPRESFSLSVVGIRGYIIHTSFRSTIQWYDIFNSGHHLSPCKLTTRLSSRYYAQWYINNSGRERQIYGFTYM